MRRLKQITWSTWVFAVVFPLGCLAVSPELAIGGLIGVVIGLVIIVLWPWLRPGGALAASYDVPRPRGMEAGDALIGPVELLAGGPVQAGRDVILSHEAVSAIPVSNPAPGLYEAITGKPLPSYAEIRARQGDPRDLKPIPHVDRDDPRDLHDQLHDDDQPWSPKTRLAAVLGRRALATRVVDALRDATGSNLLAAELADRLDTIVSQAVSEHDAAAVQELSERYASARTRIAAEAEAKLREVHDERYRGHSRLS